MIPRWRVENVATVKWTRHEMTREVANEECQPWLVIDNKPNGYYEWYEWKYLLYLICFVSLIVQVFLVGWLVSIVLVVGQ